MPKKILITGGAGFLGHHCVEHLLKNTDWEIVILDALNYAGNLNRITDIEIYPQVKQRIRFVWHDLRASISETTHKLIGKVDYVWHLASETHVDRSLEDSIPFVMSNVLGTANLLEYLKRYQPEIEKVLIFSTDEVFGPAPQGIYFKEEDRFRPSNPYAATKAGEEMIAFSFAHAFRMPIAIVRSMNILGERQYPEKFVPKTIRAILEGRRVTLHGRGPDDVSSRCWIHARNVADGLLFLTDKAKREDFYHIVGEERTVLEIANWVSEVIKGRPLKEEEIEWVDYHTARPGHDKRYALDGTKLSQMGWSPPKNLEESLRKTVRWFLEHPKWLNL
jgi:dTDP-glucose 4,6-dehydratase